MVEVVAVEAVRGRRCRWSRFRWLPTVRWRRCHQFQMARLRRRRRFQPERLRCYYYRSR